MIEAFFRPKINPQAFSIPMKSRTLVLPSVLAGLALSASANAAVIVSENFGGLDANNLSGTSADTFSSAIVTAGGSATWVANSAFKADGGLTIYRGSAYLNLGSYINDAKGASNGIFILQATIALPIQNGSEPGFATIGFAQENTPNTGKGFNNQGSGSASTNGLGTLIYRTNGIIDGFGGPSSTNIVNGPTGNTGDVTMRITLNLSSHNGVNDFGTVYFATNTGVDGAFVELDPYVFNADRNFGSILLSGFTSQASSSNTITSSFSDLTLSQIPEPAAALLGSLGMLLLFRRRR